MSETNKDKRPVGSTLVAKDSKHRLKQTQGHDRRRWARTSFSQQALPQVPQALPHAAHCGEGGPLQRKLLQAPLPTIRSGIGCSVCACQAAAGAMDEC